MALRERNSALHWAATRPEDITPAVAVAVGHFVQVGIATATSLPAWHFAVCVFPVNLTAVPNFRLVRDPRGIWLPTLDAFRTLAA
jgi:hypothetical protein